MTKNSRRTLGADTGENGVALLAALLVMLLMSAMLVGFTALIMSDQKAGFRNRDQTMAYAAAHGGLEQLTANLGQLFAANFRPTSAQVNALTATQPDYPPSMGIVFQAPGGGSGYRIMFNDDNGDGFPDTEPEPRQINSGPYQGLQGVATPFDIEVTARTGTGAEARMKRRMFTMLIPAFQFGVFSENDLSFFAGPNFDFGGKVHTNSNLFLAQGNNTQLWLRDRVTVVGEVVRTNLSNGWDTNTNYTGTVRIARSSSDTTGDTLLRNEGSLRGNGPQLPPAPVPGVTPAPGENNSPAWTTTSRTKFRNNLSNARTGARALQLPITQMGGDPVELIRRPLVNSNEDTANPSIFGQRYYSRASLRILLSDNAADITNLPGVTADPPVDLTTLLGAAGGGPGWYGANQAPTAGAPPLPSGWYDKQNNRNTTSFLSGGLQTSRFYPGNKPTNANDYYAGMGTFLQANSPLVTGFIKIEMQRQDTTWVDVTQDILSLGFTGRRISDRDPGTAHASGAPANKENLYYLNDYVWGSAPNNFVAQSSQSCPNDISPNAVIRLQRVRDDHNPWRPCGFAAASSTAPSPNRFDYIPNAFFDPREGNLRDNNANTTQTVTIGGVMYYVELDVRNLTRWLAGQIGAGGFGPQAEFTDGGYLVYFSDRRSNQRPTVGPFNGLEMAELAFEDIVNPADSANGAPNGVLDGGEDVDGQDRDGDGSNLDVRGGVPVAMPGALRTGAAPPTSLFTPVTSRVARSNPPIFFRRALKIVNGAGRLDDATRSPLTVLPTGRGLTIVSENPTYVQGNYNTGVGGGFGGSQTDHRPSAVISDSITLLSNNWNDLRSFTYMNSSECTGNTAPSYANSCYGAQDPGKRTGNDTWFRLAVVAGKGLSFLRPSWAPQDFGTDGGAHNFLRFIEGWNGTLNYRGSIVSFYTSRQGVGIYKCCTNVYSPPTRGYRFDTEFLDLSLLPPKSPAFRDVNTYEFRQVLRPTQ